MSKNFKGYTLIELLVGISIVAVIFGIGLISYREFSRRQALTGVLKQVKADLRLAQQLALTGQKPEVCTKLIGYTFTATSSNYKIIASCSGGTVETKTVDISADTTISAGSVTFKILGQGTSLSSPLTYTVTNTQAGTSGTVTIGVGGDIK